MANGQTVSGAPADVVVVAADAERLGQYEDALRKARVSTRATLDADEAEALVAGLHPDVLVLDRGLPRLILFRLYGLVRDDASETPVQVVFVGQEGDTGPGEHYLPGDPTPSNVADRVTLLLAGANAAAATTAPVETPTARDAAAPADKPDETVRPAAQAAVGDAAAAPSAGTGDTESSQAEAVTAAPETNGVAAEPEEESAAEAPPKSGRRLDVILIRVGLVLLILGALLILIQSDAYPPSLVAPGSAPATPTQRPTASPKPGAFLDGSGRHVPAVTGQR